MIKNIKFPKISVLFSLSVLMFLFFISQYSIKKTIDRKCVVDGIMSYQMFDIVKKCQKDHNYSDEDMVILEKELKRFFILTALNEKLSTGMYSRDVDNLWHSFILSTKEYASFCNKFMNCFVHHSAKENESITNQDRDNYLAFINNYEKVFQEEIHPIWLLDMSERQLA